MSPVMHYRWCLTQVSILAWTPHQAIFTPALTFPSASRFIFPVRPHTSFCHLCFLHRCHFDVTPSHSALCPPLFLMPHIRRCPLPCRLYLSILQSQCDRGQSLFQLRGDDEPPHQIHSYTLLFSLFLHFSYIADPPLRTSTPTQPHVIVLALI